MPISFSNALSSKINPSPLGPLKSLNPAPVQYKSLQSTPLNVKSLSPGVPSSQNMSGANTAGRSVAYSPVTPQPAPAIKKQTVTEYHPPATTPVVKPDKNVQPAVTPLTPATPVSTVGTTGKTQQEINDLNASRENAVASGKDPYTGVDVSRPSLLQHLVGRGEDGSPVANDAAQGLLRVSSQNPATTGPALDAYNKAVEALQQFQGDVSQRQSNIDSTGADLNFKTGQSGALQRLSAERQSQLQGAVNQQQTAIGQQIQGAQTQQSGLNSAGALGNQSQGLLLNALGSAIGTRAPISQFGVQIDPITGQPVSGGSFSSLAAQGGKIAGTQGAASDLQGKVQSIQSQLSAADANFSILNSYAQGFDSSTPIVSGLAQLYGSTAKGNEAVAGFKAQLQNVRAAYTAITGADANAAIPDNITPDQLKQVQQTLKSTGQNNLTGYQNQLNSLTSDGSSTSGNTGSGGTMFGSFFSK